MPAYLARLKNRHLVDALVLIVSLWFAYLLRYEFAIPSEAARSAAIVTPFVIVLQMLAVRRFGIHRAVGRYVSFYDLAAFISAAVAWLIPMVGVRLLAPEGVWRIPLSVSLIDTMVAGAGLLSVRLAQRWRAERWTTTKGDAKPVLLAGAGEAGAKVAWELRRHESELRVVGFVDDDPRKHGAVVAGLEVLGRSDDIPTLVAQLEVDHVIVTIVDAGADVLKRIAEICNSVPIRVRTVPTFLEIVQGSVAITKFRDVGVEDLLGRDPVHLDLDALHDYLDGRTVMVTGAGGSIGSELARQVAAMDPAHLLLVEQYEGALFEIHRELTEKQPKVSLVPMVADIADRQRMRGIFAAYRPDVVVHAAAHKHVDMMERNPSEAIKNNVFGTEIVARLAGEYGATSFVLVSTDKAVKPSSVMGASKRLAEMVVQHENDQYDKTKFIAVRFGNVMGSSGSVLPIFKDQVRKGGPVTVTHADATRYFMTIPEASRLVLTAGALGKGGEIMVLDMGEPIRIIDLARNLIRLSGYVPDEDIAIEFTGLRQGEKLTEELYDDGEAMELTRHPKIFVGRGSGHEGVEATLQSLTAIVNDGEEFALRSALLSAVAEAGAEPVDKAPGGAGEAVLESPVS